MTSAQQALYDRLDDEPRQVSGSELRVARALARMGLVRIGIGGSGIAYQGKWWWTAQRA